MSEGPQLGREDVVVARARIAGAVVTTPLVPVTIAGARVWLKCENRQSGGSFKLRGASNRLLMMTEPERGRGVVAFSSGNHARGVAIAARRLGIAATIVMPAGAPAVKVDATRAEGAEIVFYDRLTESREAIASRLAAERGATLVPSFDDPAIVAGQGTAGLEILDQLAARGEAAPPRIVVPCGGGGLTAGIALACSDAAIVAVEPDGWDDMGRSLASGTIVPVGPDAPMTLCDALQTQRVSSITFGILRRRRTTAVSVSEEKVAGAMRFAFRELGEAIEPGGAVALAALLAGRLEAIDGTVALLSGGNVDPALHARIVA